MSRQTGPGRPQEREAVRTTIVGGRPPGSGTSIGAIPRGLEVLVKKAAVDPQFRAALLRERAGAAGRIGLNLTPAERTMLAAVPEGQLAGTIAATRVPAPAVPALMGYAAAAMLAALGFIQSVSAEEAAMLGVRPDQPRNDRNNTTTQPTDMPSRVAGATVGPPLTTPGPETFLSRGERPDRPTTRPATGPSTQPATQAAPTPAPPPPMAPMAGARAQAASPPDENLRPNAINGISAQRPPAAEPVPDTQPTPAAAPTDIPAAQQPAFRQAVSRGISPVRPPATQPPNTTQPSTPPATQPVSAQVAERVQQLIPKLGDNDYTTRERATDELVALGKGILPLLDKVQSDDPEVVNRLALIRNRLDPKPEPPPDDRVMIIAGMMIKR